ARPLRRAARLRRSEARHERVARELAAQVRAQRVAVLEVAQHDEARAARLDERAGGARLVVAGMAVDDGGEAVLDVLEHAPVRLLDPRAARVDDLAAGLLESLEVLHLGGERGNDREVLALHALEAARLGVLAEDEAHAAAAEVLVHLRVVDDLVQEPEAAAGIL